MRVTRDGDEPVPTNDAKEACLQNVRMHHRMTEAAITNRHEAIDMARRFGATWDDIGAAMGMSRQAAHKRFSAHVE